MSRESILLTGGAGLIGSAALRLLNQLGHTNILVVDKLGSSPWKWKNLAQCQFADYMEYDDFDVNHLPRTVSTIIHIGARSYTTEQDAAFLMRNNYRFSVSLANWTYRHRARFVYASSAATYGADTAMDDTAPIEELKPLNIYGYSKHLFDLWLSRYNHLQHSDGASAVGLKYFNVFGPPWERHKGEQASLVLKAYDSLRANKPIELFESARPDVKTEDIRRDFLAVEDAAKVTVWAALDPVGRKTAGLYNVGSGIAHSFTDLARWTGRAMNLDPLQEGEWISYVPMPEQLRTRYQYFTKAPISKLRAAGYTDEFTPLDQAIARYVGLLAKEDGR